MSMKIVLRIPFPPEKDPLMNGGTFNVRRFQKTKIDEVEIANNWSSSKTIFWLAQFNYF